MLPPPSGQRRALPAVRLSPSTSSQTLGFPDGEVAGKIFKRKKWKQETCVGGRREGRWENGLDFVCVVFLLIFFFLVVVCNFP